ncbi:hypothetical protein TanjilG_06812 [Lupinus angustifolius]|uniref:Uncharacterized protein n=1 Tax=Lupinus angustifolius TaxID=3871 RepID=A0A1J7H209_LUPAN|nr:hypothetical protein TanjilG_06812 [Lupinus angustifolius]
MNPMNSSSSSSFRRKHRCSATVAYAATRRMFMTHKKYNSYCSNSNSSMMDDEVSARELAAGLWHLRFMEEVSGDGSHSQVANGNEDITFSHYDNIREKLGNVDVKMFPHYHNSGEVKKIKDLQRPITILRSRSGLECELKSSVPCLKCSKEEAKLDPALAEASNGSTKNHSMKFLEDKMLVGYHDSVVTALLNELLLAQKSINMLKSAYKSSKKKAEQFFQNVEEEKVHWKHREYKKIQAMLDNLNDKLSRETKSREGMELVNTKLLHELAEANFYGKQIMKNYEKEKKERELTEQVCNQLVMQIGEDKAKIEELLSVSLKLCEEVEEERNMMQMVNLWREERAQMKLDDAKLVLEDKYNQMIQLIGYLQVFLRSRGAELSTMFESVNIQQIVELPYYFSKFEEIFPISEKLGRDNAGPLSTLDIVSPHEKTFNKNSVFDQSSPSGDYNADLEQTNSSETSYNVEDQKISSSPHRRGTYLINDNRYKNILGNEAECSENLGMKSLNSPSKCKPSSASKLLRLCPNVRTTSSYAKASQHRRQGKGSIQGSFRHKKLLGQGNSRDTMNPHIARGMKGCIEWPRGTSKENSKVIPLEERVRSQKSQLQNILKGKA